MTAIRVTRELLQQMPLAAPETGVDKNERGKVMIVGSSTLSAGAAPLSGMASFRAGAGKVTLAVPETLAIAIGTSFPEAGVMGFAVDAASNPMPREASAQISEIAARCDALLMGPGLADERSATALAIALLRQIEGPALIVDALALAGLWDVADAVRRHHGRLVITPHAGEMAALTGWSRDAIEADPQHVAIEAARHLECIVVLKGACTVIAQPRGDLFLYEADIPGLATSGSGDVLAGTMIGLMARGTSPLQAAVHAVALHAEAGQRLADRIGPLGFLARELPDEIPGLLRKHAAAVTGARAVRA